MRPSRPERKAFERSVRKVRYADLVKAPHRYRDVPVQLFGPIEWIRELENGTTIFIFENSDPGIIGSGNSGVFFATLPDYTQTVAGDFVRVYGWLDGWDDQYNLPALKVKWVDKASY
jgi:hypothetical protein